MQTIFEYCYRDAGNFKAFGSVTLDGSLTPQEENDVRSKLESGDYFSTSRSGFRRFMTSSINGATARSKPTIAGTSSLVSRKLEERTMAADARCRSPRSWRGSRP